MARLLGITVAAVSAWQGIVPPRRILQLSAITGRPVSDFLSENSLKTNDAVTREELRLDIFRRDGDAA